MKMFKMFWLGFVFFGTTTQLAMDHDYFIDLPLTDLHHGQLNSSSNELGLSNFHMSAAYNHTPNINWYLHNGYGVNSSDNQYGITPLMLATVYGALDAARLLTQAGANPYQTNVSNISSYDVAQRDGKHQFLNLFHSQLALMKTVVEDAQRYGLVMFSFNQVDTVSKVQNNTNLINPLHEIVEQDPVEEKSESYVPASKRKKQTVKKMFLVRTSKGRFKKRKSGRSTKPRTFYGDE